MYLSLAKHVVIVHGPAAVGVYDLAFGEFHRVTKDAGALLAACDGTIAYVELHAEQREFIDQAVTKGLVRSLPDRQIVPQTRIEDVIRPLRLPKFAWVEITSKCNQECLHCFLGDQLNASPHIPVDRLRNYADELAQIGVNQVVLSGGEPTLHPKFRDILAYYAKHRFRLVLLTNASSKIFFSLIEEFRKFDVTVKVPILGWEHSHDEMTGLKGGFDRTIAAVRALASAGVRTQLGTTVTGVNEADIAKIQAFADDVRLPIEFSPIFSVGWAKKNHSRLVPHSMRKVIEICQIENRPRKSMANKPTADRQMPEQYAAVDLRQYLTNHHECGQKIIALLANGTVTPCLMLRGPEHQIGNLATDSLTAIVKGEVPRASFDNSMRLDRIPGCRDCEARFVCKAGGCPASAYALTGFVARKNPLYDKCYYAENSLVPSAMEQGFSINVPSY